MSQSLSKFISEIREPRRILWRKVAEIKVREIGGLVMITKAVIALILFGLTSSANAMTVIFKDYKAAANKDEKAFYLLYLDGVREGISNLTWYWKRRDSSRFSACPRSWS